MDFIITFTNDFYQPYQLSFTTIAQELCRVWRVKAFTLEKKNYRGGGVQYYCFLSVKTRISK